MPFESKAQQGKCFAMKERGQARSWDCAKWAKETPDLKALPERKAAPKRRYKRRGE